MSDGHDDHDDDDAHGYVGAPYQVGSETSKESAKAVAPKVESQCRRVYDYIKENPLQSDVQIREALDIDPNGITARRRTLQKAGLVEPHPKIRAKNPSGKSAMAWQVTDVPYPDKLRDLPSKPKDESIPTKGEIRAAMDEIEQIYLRDKGAGNQWSKTLKKVLAWTRTQGCQ